MRALILGAGLVLAALAPSMARAQGEPRLPDLMAAGDEAFASARYDDALRSYSQVLRRDSTSAHAIFRVATLLGWRNEFDQSIGLFRKYLTLSPDDAAGRIALARVIAWSRDFPQALAMCDTMLRENPENRDAALLAAQATAWSGQYEGAAERYDRWLARHPGDAEAWNALAQVWQWCGRTGRARDALRHAVAVEPTNAAALAQLQLTDAALSASVEPGITSTDDSDENRTVTYLIRAGFAAPWNARAQADAIYRSADLGVARGTSATVRASSSWTPIGGSWTLRGGLGAAQLDGDGGVGHRTHLEPLANLGLSGRIVPRLALGADVTRAAFDETASLIFAGIVNTSAEGEAAITLHPRLSLGLAGGWTRLTGGTSANSRLGGSGVLRWTVNGALSVATDVRSFGYDHAAADGYFAPQHYLLSEGSARLHLGGELGWVLDSELGLGDQRISAFDHAHAGRFAERYSAVLAYRPAVAVEWSLGGSFANVASPTTISSADYRAYSISIKGRVRL